MRYTSRHFWRVRSRLKTKLNELNCIFVIRQSTTRSSWRTLSRNLSRLHEPTTEQCQRGSRRKESDEAHFGEEDTESSEKQAQDVTHWPFRSCRPSCVQARVTDCAHKSQESEEEAKHPEKWNWRVEDDVVQKGPGTKWITGRDLRNFGKQRMRKLH